MPSYVKTKLQQQRYKEKYSQGDFVVKNVDDIPRVFYNPSPRLGLLLQVLFPGEKEST